MSPPRGLQGQMAQIRRSPQALMADRAGPVTLCKPDVICSKSAARLTGLERLIPNPQ